MSPVVDLPELDTASPWCQRWTARRPTWVHVDGPAFEPSRYEVAPLAQPAAKDFVTARHYSGTFPAAVHRYGLLERPAGGGSARLVGVAVFGVPVQAKVLTAALPSLQPYVESLELSRFVLSDAVPGNGESWFLARCFSQLLTAGVRGVVSFADPVPRVSADGRLVAPGHVGFIYQASNAVYTGRGTARTVALLPDGTVLNARSASKVRAQEQGHAYVEARLVALGARPPAAGVDMARWLAGALDQVGARALRHGGNHRYVFRLGANRRAREAVEVGYPQAAYPKHADRPS